jgi:hypothetical protein
MKTGWVMEWEMQVCYLAPVRAEFNTMAKAFSNMRPAMTKMGTSVAEAVRALNTFFAVWNQP